MEAEKSRLEMLQQALEATPDNAFLRYGLAMELANACRNEEATAEFEHLLAHHPDYAATYYQAGMLYARLNRLEEAKRVLNQGLQVTEKQGNTHAKQEIQVALDELAEDAP